ncbi:MAG: hypothetical protein AB7G13_26830 [Lautropia sp.]
MAKWSTFPYADAAYEYDAAGLKKHWARLHRGDCEPFPKQKEVVDAWIDFHAGRFADAVAKGLAAGPTGHNAANKAAAIHATYLETTARIKQAIFEEIAERCVALQRADPKNANAFYLHAYALGRYAQGMSIVKALAQGIGGKVKESLLQAIKLAPKHADAHTALGTYHAEVVDKVGATIGGLTYGAKRDEGLKLFRKALELNPDSAIARIEYANGLVMLDGKKALAQAEALYAEAAACEPADATERLDVELARSES